MRVKIRFKPNYSYDHPVTTGWVSEFRFYKWLEREGFLR